MEDTISIDDFKSILIGRGIWHLLHTCSANANTVEEGKHCIWTINTMVDNFICKECKDHAILFLKNNPPNKAAFIKKSALKSSTNSEEFIFDKEALFKWLYMFHCSANNYANKSSPNYETVKQFYFAKDKHCDKHCGATKS